MAGTGILSLLPYGLNSIGGSKFIKKTDDRIEINSLLGKKFTNNLIGNWSYSSFVNFKTQWTKGFRYSNSSGEETKTELSEFFHQHTCKLVLDYWRKTKDLWVQLCSCYREINSSQQRFYKVS